MNVIHALVVVVVLINLGFAEWMIKKMLQAHKEVKHIPKDAPTARALIFYDCQLDILFKGVIVEMIDFAVLSVLSFAL